MLRSRLLASCLVACLVSCAPSRAADLPWHDGAGGQIEFALESQRSASEEGLFDASRPANRLIPTKPISARGRYLELRLRGTGPLPRRLRVELSSRPDGKQAFTRAALLLVEETSLVVLALPAEAALASISLRLETGDSAQGGFVLESIALAAPFKGLDRSVDTPRYSSDFNQGLKEGRRIAAIERPFADMAGAPALASVGARSANESLRPALVFECAPADPSYAALGETIFFDIYGAAQKPRRLRLRARPSGQRLILDEPSLPLALSSIERIEASLPSGLKFKAFYAGLVSGEKAELADLGRVLAASPAAGKPDFDLYRWDLLPAVLILDIRDYATQDRYLKRLAFFTEKAGYRGTLQTNEVLAPLHGWNAHDYRPEDLAAFFHKAAKESFPLNPEEIALRELLRERGLILEQGQGFKAGAGALVSISRESSAALRRTFLAHETTHGIFFVDEEYRAFVSAEWKSMSPGEAWFWKRYFRWMNYDTDSAYLMANEYQAYLLQQPLEKVSEYFTKSLPQNLLNKKVLEREPELAAKVDAYMLRYGESFVARARRIDDWLGKKYGISGGFSGFLSY